MMALQAASAQRHPFDQRYLFGIIGIVDTTSISIRSTDDLPNQSTSTNATTTSFTMASHKTANAEWEQEEEGGLPWGRQL